MRWRWDRANSLPFWAFFPCMCGPLFKMSRENKRSWSFILYLSHLTSSSCPHWQKETKSGSENHAFHWATIMGREPCTVGHWVMPGKERMPQLEGNAVFAVPCKLCHEATRQFVRVDMSAHFTCRFSIYVVIRRNATCMAESLNAVGIGKLC